MRRLMKESKDREQAIKTAALRLFSEKGFYATSTRDICEEAGVSKGTLYWHWKSKEEIAFALVSEMLGRFLTVIEGMRDEAAPVEEKLKRLAIGIAELYYQETPYLRLLWKFRADRHYIFSPAYTERVVSYYLQMRKALEDIIAQGVESGELRKVDPKQMAFIFLGITEGFELQWLENEEDFSMREALPAIIDMIMPGLRK
jgi:TetR/AcrR family transcriptional regulator, cholesterol catabolism regulator